MNVFIHVQSRKIQPCTKKNSLSPNWLKTHTIGLLRISRRLRKRTLAGKRLLEGSTKAGGEVVGWSVPKSSWHTHGACAEWCCKTAESSRSERHPQNLYMEMVQKKKKTVSILFFKQDFVCTLTHTSTHAHTDNICSWLGRFYLKREPSKAGG